MTDVPKKKRKGKIVNKPEKDETVTKCCYVFSTGMANRAGRAVEKGMYDSVTAYHEAQEWETPYLSAELHCSRMLDDPDEKFDDDVDNNSIKSETDSDDESKASFSASDTPEIKSTPLNSFNTFSQGDLTLAQAATLLAQTQMMNRPEEKWTKIEEKDVEQELTAAENQEASWAKEEHPEGSTFGANAISDEIESKLNPLHPRYALFHKGVVTNSEKVKERQSPSIDVKPAFESISTSGPNMRSDATPDNKDDDKVAPQERTIQRGNELIKSDMRSNPENSDTRSTSDSRVTIETMPRSTLEKRMMPDLRLPPDIRSTELSSTIESRFLSEKRPFIESTTTFGPNSSPPRDVTENKPMISSSQNAQDSLSSSNPSDIPTQVSESSQDSTSSNDGEVKVDVVKLDEETATRKFDTSSLIMTSTEHPASPILPQPPQKPTDIHPPKTISYPADITKENFRYQSPKSFKIDRLEESPESKPFTSRPSVLNMSMDGVPTTENVRSSIDIAEKALKEARTLPFKPTATGPILPRDIHHSAFMSRHSSYLQPPMSALNGPCSSSIFSSRLHSMGPFSRHTSQTASPFRAPRSSERQSSHLPVNPHISPHYRHQMKNPPDPTGYHGMEKCKTFTSAAGSHPGGHHSMFERPASTGDINRHMSLSDRHSSLSERHLDGRLPLNDRHSSLNEHHLSMSERIDRTLAMSERHAPPSISDRFNERMMSHVEKQQALQKDNFGDLADRALGDRTTSLKDRGIRNDIPSPSPLHMNHRKEKVNPFSVETLTAVPDKPFKKPEEGHPLDRPPDRHFDAISRSLPDQSINERLHMSSIQERLHLPNGMHSHNGLKRSLDEHRNSHMIGPARGEKRYIDTLHEDRFSSEQERYLMHEKDRYIHHPRLPGFPGGPGHTIRVNSNYMPRSMPNGSVRSEHVPSPPSHPTYPPGVHRVHPFSTTHR